MTTNKNESTGKRKLPLFQSLAEILVRRGLAASVEQAAAMVRNGKFSIPEHGGVVTDPDEQFRTSVPIKLKHVVTFDPERKPADRAAAK